MKTARKFFNWLNKHIFDKMGFRLILASSTKRSLEMGKEMDAYRGMDWPMLDKYSFREDSIDAKYDFYLRLKERNESEDTRIKKMVKDISCKF